MLPVRCRNHHRLSVLVRRVEGKPDQYAMQREYETLLRHYKNLCTDCNLESRSVRHHVWLKRFRYFLDHLRSQIVPLMYDVDFRDSVRNLLCTVRCQNLPHWPPRLHRSFFNWMCHRTAYVGYEILRLNPDALDGLAGTSPETLVENVRSIIDPPMDRQALQLAYDAFYLAHLARVTRRPLTLDVEPICGETADAGHEYQVQLMYVLRQVTQEYLRAMN